MNPNRWNRWPALILPILMVACTVEGDELSDDDDDIMPTTTTGGSTGYGVSTSLTSSSSGDPTTTTTGDEPGTTTGEDPTTTSTTDSSTTSEVPPTEETGTGTNIGSSGGDLLEMCLFLSSYTASGTIDDPHGHFTFLYLFYDDSQVDSLGSETVSCSSEGTTIRCSIDARDGAHNGLGEVSGELEGDCSFTLNGTVPFTSETGDFGDVDVTYDGELGQSPYAYITVEGGNIPSGPITYQVDLEPND